MRPDDIRESNRRGRDVVEFFIKRERQAVGDLVRVRHKPPVSQVVTSFARRDFGFEFFDSDIGCQADPLRRPFVTGPE
jgi:hypothetical protein